MKSVRRYVLYALYALLGLFVTSLFVQFVRPSAETVARQHLESIGFEEVTPTPDEHWNYSLGIHGSEKGFSLEQITLRFRTEQDSGQAVTIVVARPMWFSAWRVERGSEPAGKEE